MMMITRSARTIFRPLTLLAATAAVALGAGAAQRATAGACSDAAASQQSACEAEAADDFFVAQAICANGSRARARECNSEAREDRSEAQELCQEQRTARETLCVALGGGRYDPDFAPAHFDDDFADLTRPNPYFPLRVGYRWEYAGAESISIEVRDATKRIEGVTCIVVNDRVGVDGRLVEDTDDWFAQRKDGTVVYCGEQVKDFETFAGDDPETPELVAIDGSFKAGRDGALPGTQFLASPSVGDVYRQEWSLNNAEDAARVLSTSYDFGSDPELAAHVPQALAELLCDGDCVVTSEFTPIEPDAVARKYYAAGIGLFLEVVPESGEIVQLIGCNVDPRCNALPSP